MSRIATIPTNDSLDEADISKLSKHNTICGGTTGSLGLIGLFINDRNISLILQCLYTLIEFCQGPCSDNQNAIATNESNGLNGVVSMITSDIKPLCIKKMDLVLDLKINASKLLLAIVESRTDSVQSRQRLCPTTTITLLKLKL
ncbi:hypothetical protein MXB_2724 [Myxobolus squamalis]|nr:hypothetical protein MXB_2724 [Myxobolus squamalis]